MLPENLFAANQQGMWIYFIALRVWDYLVRIDEEEAERCRKAGCPHCSGKLHKAYYMRAGWGLPKDWKGDLRRYSFCCADCRRRTTPPSVRFAGRRFYVAPVFMALSAAASDAAARRFRLLHHPTRKTLARWRQWWTSGIRASRIWALLGHGLQCDGNTAQAWTAPWDIVVDGKSRPASVLRRLLSGLRKLLPWTPGSPEWFAGTSLFPGMGALIGRRLHNGV